MRNATGQQEAPSKVKMSGREQEHTQQNFGWAPTTIPPFKNNVYLGSVTV